MRRQVRCQAYSALAHLVPATAAAYPGGLDGAGGRAPRPRKLPRRARSALTPELRLMAESL